MYHRRIWEKNIQIRSSHSIHNVVNRGILEALGGCGPSWSPRLSGSELLGKPVSEVLEWLFPLFDDLTQILCERDDAATLF